MSEAGFRLFGRGFFWGSLLLYALALALFLRPFLAGDGAARRRRSAAVFFGALALCLVCGRAGMPQGLAGLLLAALLTAAAGPLGLSRGLAFLLAVLYWNARVTGGLVTESLYYIAQGLLPPRPGPPAAVYLRAAALMGLFFLSHAVLLAAMLALLVRRLKKQPFSLHRPEVCYLCLIPAAGILFGQIISRLLVEFRDGVLLQLYDRHPAFLAAVPLLALLFFAGSWLTIAFQQGMAALRAEQADAVARWQQTQALQARLGETQRLWAGLRHELRGHLENLLGLARTGQDAALQDYLSRLGGTLADAQPDLWTGEPVTGLIVGDKQRQCAAKGILFRADFRYPAAGGYDPFDLGIILQNLLQNALEACERAPAGDRRITLTGKRKGRFFLIEVKNTFAGPLALGVNGLPATTKKEPALHGIGLSNVRREAEKYLGGLELRADGREFSAAVLLQERSSV